MRVLLVRVFLVAGSSLPSLQTYPAIPLLIEFLLRNPLTILCKSPCMLFVVFLLLLFVCDLCLNFHYFDYYVCWSIPPYVCPTWDLLHLLDMVDYFLSMLGMFFSYYLFKCFLRSFLSLSSV